MISNPYYTYIKKLRKIKIFFFEYIYQKEKVLTTAKKLHLVGLDLMQEIITGLRVRCCC